MSPTMLLALLAGLAASGAFADPYDPALLNESAMDAIRQGDLETARILLERAARVAPYDPRIARNLRALDAHRAGARARAEPEVAFLRRYAARHPSNRSNPRSRPAGPGDTMC